MNSNVGLLSVCPSKHSDPEVRVKSDHLLNEAGYDVRRSVGPRAIEVFTPAARRISMLAGFLLSALLFLFISFIPAASLLQAIIPFAKSAIVVAAIAYVLLELIKPNLKSRPKFQYLSSIAGTVFLSFLLTSLFIAIIPWEK